MTVSRPALVRATLVVAGVVLVGWVVVVALAATSARSDLRAAESHLQQAQQVVRDADVDGAQARLEQAAEAATRAHGRLDALPVRAMAALPWVGNTLDVATAVASAAADVTGSALDVVGTLASSPDGLEALLPTEGGLPIAPLRALGPPLAALDAELSAAAEALAAAPTSFVLAEADAGRARMADLVDELGPDVATAASLATELPSFLGGDGPRRYLLTVGNPAELRAFGGFIGAYALVTMDDGAIDVGGFGATWNLPNRDAGDVEPPDPTFAARYGDHNATGLWSNTNMSPDFPTVATVLERLWHATSDDPIDGVIHVDPFALQALLELTGPVEVPETGAVLRPATVVDYVANESFAELDDPLERKEGIGGVAAASLGAFLSGEVDRPLRRVLNVLGDAVAGRHLALHSVDPDEQAALVRAGLAAEFADPGAGSFFAVAYNSGTASKVDYWLEERVTHRLRLLDDGRAEATTTVTLHNDAPTTGVSRVVGPNAEGLEAGDNRLMVSLYCGSRCTFLSASGDDGQEVTVAPELDGLVASAWAHLASGEQTSLEFVHVVEDAWRSEAGELVLDVAHHDQTMIRPGALEVVVEVPDAFRPASLPDDARVDDGHVRWERTAHGDAGLRLTFTPESG